MALHAGFGPHAHGCVCADCVSDCDDDSGHKITPLAHVDYGDADDGRFHSKDEANARYVSAAVESGAGLISGRAWSTTDLTFSFPTASEAFDTNELAAGVQYGSGEATNGFSPLNAGQIAAARFALDQFAAVSGLTFTEIEEATAGDATIRLAQSAAPATAWGYYPSSSEEGGDAWLGVERGYYDEPTRGDYAWHTVMHEIGHTLGLKHGHDNGGAGALAAAEDSMEFSVMTYRSYVGDPLWGGYSNETWGYAQTLMQLDIAAVQQLYGANYDHNAGDTVYSWDAATGEAFVDGVGQGAPGAARIFETVWDGDGVDTFDFSNHESDMTIDLRPGAGSVIDEDRLANLSAFETGGKSVFASANVYAARLHQGDERALIENAKAGSGNDVIVGNGAANALFGGAGSDRLSGAAGRDELNGGAGDDILDGGGARDVLRGDNGGEVGGEGADDLLRGGGGADALFGEHGSDMIFGGWGKDRISGGAGDDHLTGGRGADRFIFAAGDGHDVIRDFKSGEDRIDVSAFDASFDQLVFRDLGDDLIVSLRDVSIELNGVESVTAGDFIF